MAFNKSKFAQEMAFNKSKLSQEMGYKYSALQQDQAQFDASMDYKINYGGSGTAESSLKEPTESQMTNALDAYNAGGMQSLNQYINALPSTVDKDLIAEYVGSYGTYDTAENPIPLEQRTFTKVKETYNGLGGIDNNDIVEDQYGNQFKIKDLPESLQVNLTLLGINETYNQK
jgi:hypothetical protein